MIELEAGSQAIGPADVEHRWRKYYDNRKKQETSERKGGKKDIPEPFRQREDWFDGFLFRRLAWCPQLRWLGTHGSFVAVVCALIVIWVVLGVIGFVFVEDYRFLLDC